MIKILKIMQGPAGPPGGGGGSGGQPVQVIQSSPSLTWIINHNLGYRPQVQVYTSGGLEVFAEVIHTSINQYQVSFVQPSTGFTIYQ